jgi:hypothetical protein
MIIFEYDFITFLNLDEGVNKILQPTPLENLGNIGLSINEIVADTNQISKFLYVTATS